ncbi:hypothetical protein HPP92_009668 [Vanilla planifolia]|uniref:Uncharacterized protein n=1 Tax=Vanilla planifolia TaxID=51239 RepID=A0A835V326_VANPL|nr:hypothetical protein HPP92_009668 [Vanilla planifolia]
MKETIRCCISCILPCGALDVVRIVHANGRVEEIGGGRRHVLAAEVMQAYPKHVLRKPPSPASLDHDCSSASARRRPVTLPPTAELKRGRIYFLTPVVSSPGQKPQQPPAPRRRRRRPASTSGDDSGAEKLLSRRGRIDVWRPRLESISELAIADRQ